MEAMRQVKDIELSKHSSSHSSSIERADTEISELDQKHQLYTSMLTEAEKQLTEEDSQMR
jgi:hypothetical protein